MYILIKPLGMNNIIYLEIDGTENLAWAAEIANRQHSMFRISFKDGYENIFYTDIESGRWIEEDMGYTELAEKVGGQVRTFARTPLHVPKLLTWHKQLVNNKLISFGFYSYTNGNQKFYQIFNENKKFLYTIVDMDTDEWEILGNPLSINSRIDTGFIHHVIEALSLYAAKAK